MHPVDVHITEIVKHSFGVISEIAPSFSVSVISHIDSRISFIAGHTASSAVEGSLSLLRKPYCANGRFCGKHDRDRAHFCLSLYPSRH